MQNFDEWIAQHYPMFQLTGDREEDTTARLVRVVALDLFNQRTELLNGLGIAIEALADGLWDYGPGQDEHDKCNEVLERLRTIVARATGSQS